MSKYKYIPVYRSAVTRLQDLPTTDSGHVKKKHAVRWLQGLDKPTDGDLKSSVVPKPADFSGSKYPTEVSGIRMTGDPEFIETAAGLLQPLIDLEDHENRLEINLQKTEGDDGEWTGNYALYLGVAERG
jgi:hypothetical protein